MVPSGRFAVLILVLATSACGADAFEPPVPVGRQVRIVVTGGPDGKLEMISGSLVAWNRGWLSLKREGGELSHFATAVVVSVHEESGR